MLTTDDIKILIKKYALQNAVKYNKLPQAGSVMGKVMAAPELRTRAKEVNSLVGEVLDEINQMSPDSWEQELNRLAPELIAELKEKKEPEKGLPPLDIKGLLVMRFAPNPNGPPTIGSSRGIVVNSEYTKKYNGKFIIRFDDTDPATKRPMLEAYTWYLDDCEWLGAKPDEVVIASDRIPKYYEVAEQLIKKGGAYVCFCEQEEFKALKDVKKACPHREKDVEENLASWQKMLSGEYKEQEAVLRIKTDIAHKDPAIRDWVAFRIIKTPHPRPEVADKYNAWPLLDFEGAVEDHLLGTTLIIRGKDLTDSETRQRYIYKYMGWKYPETMHWGRVQIHDENLLSEEPEYLYEFKGQKYGVKEEYVRPDEKTQSPYEMDKRGYPVAVRITEKGNLGFHNALRPYSLEELATKNGYIMVSENLSQNLDDLLIEEPEYFYEYEGQKYGVKEEYVRLDEKTQSPYEKENRRYPVAVGITTKGKLRFHSALKLYQLKELTSKNGYIMVSEKLIENIDDLSSEASNIEEPEYFYEYEGQKYNVKEEYVRPDEKTQSPYEKEKKIYPVAVGITANGNLVFKRVLIPNKLKELTSKNGFIMVSEPLIKNLGKLSTSGLKKGIADGIYSGWDDPRMPTIRALRRRGIRSEALRKFMIELGLGETDISLSLDTLYAENRKIVDPIANRYFFVWDPVELEVEGAEPKVAKAPLHPSRGGMREIPAGTKVLICQSDVENLKEDEKLRLKDLYNIQITGLSPLSARFIGTDMDLVKKEKARIIHWAPLDGLKVRVLSPDGEYSGIGERGIEKDLDKVVQFERFGFVRIDSVSGDEVVAYYTHK